MILNTHPRKTESRTNVRTETESPTVAVLSAGRDPHYALGLASALIAERVSFDFVGSDLVDAPLLHGNPLVKFFNLRGSQAAGAGFVTKVRRILQYYFRLVFYAVYARPRVFHILWNNKFEWFDRTLLMLWYRLCGRKIVFTAHNVNAAVRDRNDSFLNRLTLKVQYGLSDSILVHTDEMRHQLTAQFEVPLRKVTVIPYGLNDYVPDTNLTSDEARRRIGLDADDRVLLFFGHITPYKGLDYLVEALKLLRKENNSYRLVIAGQPKGDDVYWKEVENQIANSELNGCVRKRIDYIPDEDTEVYFKAADALVLPYTYIFQSGVLFLGYNFGLPVLAADVGSLKEDIVEGRTGFVFRPKDPEELARTIQTYFESDLYRRLGTHRAAIRAFAVEKHSWGHVVEITNKVYAQLSGPGSAVQIR